MKPGNGQSSMPSAPLESRAVVALTGLSYLFTGIGFSYLDRSYGGFGVQSLLWLVWALLGFGAGVLNIRRPPGAGRTQWKVMGVLGIVLALFPGMLMYALPRWSSVTLMVIMGARAPMLRTQRDFYLTLTVIFVVSFMVSTRFDADWSLWFYLGPAWLLGALALAWQHAAGTVLSRWIRLSMTLGFIGIAGTLAAALFLFAPRPPTLGFGFLPPGTDTPGLFDRPAGEGEAQAATGAGQAGKASGASGLGQGRDGTAGGQWQAMLDHMRSASRDPFMPRWQRDAIQRMLGAAQSLLDWGQGSGSPSSGEADGEAESPPSGGLSAPWWWWLVLLASWLLWRHRYRLGLRIALVGAWVLASRWPAGSMRLSAWAMTWCLSGQRHYRLPGQSVREHWASARCTAPLARRWLGQALEAYCAMRFGGVPATRERALHMRQAVQGSSDILLGLAPELGQ